MSRQPTVPLLVRQRALVLKWTGLVPYIVRRLEGRPELWRLGRDDAEAEGYLALCRAAAGYRPDLHPAVKFQSYACRTIYVELLRAGRTRGGVIAFPDDVFKPDAKPYRRAAAERAAAALRLGDMPAHLAQDGTPLEHVLFVAPPDTGQEEVDARDLVDFVARQLRLTRKQRKVLLDHYAQDRTLAETAQRQKVHRVAFASWLDRLLRRARRLLGLRPRSGEELGPVTEETLRKRWEAGQSAAAIGRDLGISEHMVYKFCKKFGLSRQKARPAAV